MCDMPTPATRAQLSFRIESGIVIYAGDNGRRPATDCEIELWAALSSAEAQEGWVMVPREPTKEMLAAAQRWIRGRGIWDDMLASAPTIPGDSGAGDGVGEAL